MLRGGQLDQNLYILRSIIIDLFDLYLSFIIGSQDRIDNGVGGSADVGVPLIRPVVLLGNNPAGSPEAL